MHWDLKQNAHRAGRAVEVDLLEGGGAGGAPRGQLGRQPRRVAAVHLAARQELRRERPSEGAATQPKRCMIGFHFLFNLCNKHGTYREKPHRSYKRE